MTDSPGTYARSNGLDRPHDQSANADVGGALRPLMPTPLTKTILTRWVRATPVHAISGRWVAYLSIEAAAFRAATLVDAQPPDQMSAEAVA